jgi:hypothetical protein
MPRCARLPNYSGNEWILLRICSSGQENHAPISLPLVADNRQRNNKQSLLLRVDMLMPRKMRRAPWWRMHGTKSGGHAEKRFAPAFMAGAYLGKRAIPERWLQAVREDKYPPKAIEELADRLFAKYAE